jgi:hypothetical protein
LGCIDNYLPYRNTTPLVAPQAGVTRMAAHRSVLPSSARAAVEAVAGVRVAHPVAGFRNYLPDCCDELRSNSLGSCVLLGQLHRALRVGEQDCDLLALAFERASRREDLLR